MISILVLPKAEITITFCRNMINAVVLRKVTVMDRSHILIHIKLNKCIAYPSESCIAFIPRTSDFVQTLQYLCADVVTMVFMPPLPNF